MQHPFCTHRCECWFKPHSAQQRWKDFADMLRSKRSVSSSCSRAYVNCQLGPYQRRAKGVYKPCNCLQGAL